MNETEALKAALSFNNDWFEYSTFVVLAGLVFELVMLLAFHKTGSWKEKLVLISGTLIIAIGVAGEWHFGSKASAAATRLQEISDEKVAAFSKDAAEAKKDAADAVERAAKLEKEAADARSQIAEANSRAAEATKEASEAQLALQQFKAPRWITDTQQEAFIGHLTQFHGVSVAVWLTHATSPDAPAFAAKLLSVLAAAQWNTHGVLTLLAGVSGAGILVATRASPVSNDQAAAEALVSELNSAGLSAHLAKGVTDTPVNVLGAFIGDAPQPPADLWVIVGSKP